MKTATDEPTATVRSPFLKYAKSNATMQPAIALSFEFVLFSMALAHALVLAVEVLCTSCEARRHLVLGQVVGLLRYVSEVCLVESLQWHAGVCHHVPCRRLAFCHSQVVVAADQRACESAEDDGELELRHAWVLAYDAVLLGVGIEEQEAVLLAEGNACLVEDAVGESDILALRLTGNLDDLHLGQLDVVCLCHCHDIGDEHGCAGRQAADGQAALDGALDATL